MPQWIVQFFTNPIFFTWIGALCGHILSLYSKDFRGTKPFLEKLLPNKSETVYFRIDFLILPIIGSLLAFILLEPTGLKSSVFAGLSWSGALTALLRKNSDSISKPDTE
jgi:hypothetical protein